APARQLQLYEGEEGDEPRAPPLAHGASPPPDPEVGEPALPHPHRVEDVAAIEDDRVLHEGAHAIEVRVAELVPLGDQAQGVGVGEGLVRGGGEVDAVTEALSCRG